MATLRYVGRTPDSDAVIVPKSYADSAASTAALTNSWVNTAAALQFPNLTTQSYVDTEDGLRAHKIDVDAADAVFAPVSWLNTSNGIAGLDSSGNLLSGQLSVGLLTDRIIQSYSLKTVVPSFDVSGAGYRHGQIVNISGSWAHDVDPDATTVFMAGSLLSTKAFTFTPTFGGVAMDFIGSQNIVNSSGSNVDVVFIWGLQNPPTGEQTAAFSTTGGGTMNVAMNTFSYFGCAGWGSPTFTHAVSTAISNTIRATYDQLVLSVIGVDPTTIATTIGTPHTTAGTAVSRYNAGGQSAVNWPTQVNESPGGPAGSSSVTITATGPATTLGYGIMSVALLPQNAPEAIGNLLFSPSMTISGTSSPQQMAEITIPDPGYPWRPIPYGLVSGDSSGTTKPSLRTTGTSCYGLVTVAPDPAISTQVYGIGICTGSWFTDSYPITPYAAAGQTPTSVPPINGGMQLYLYGSVWSGTTYTFYANSLSYGILVVPAL